MRWGFDERGRRLIAWSIVIFAFLLLTGYILSGDWQQTYQPVW